MKLPRRLSEPGPIIEYIAMLQQAGKKNMADDLVRDIRTALGTREGANLLELMDKAVLERSVSPSADPRALDAINAQSFIALDLRRVLSDEFDATLETEKTDIRPGRRRGSRA